VEIDPDAESETGTFGTHPFAGHRQFQAFEPARDNADQARAATGSRLTPARKRAAICPVKI
jgi:hypothetical protein